MSEKLIVIDWGTSNFRAFLVDADSGQCLDRRVSDKGLLSLSSPQFGDYCQSQIEDWREDGLVPVYLAGMVGSARGWVEAPQLSLPVGIEDLVEEAMTIPGLSNSWIIPGAKKVSNTHVDVMRGEEVQALGALLLSGQTDAICCLPGTHSKWVSLVNQRIVHFTTMMTGELFHAVRFHTLPGEAARGETAFDEQAFQLGLERVNDAAGVLHALFETRSRHLYAGLSEDQAGSYLSGVLIGEEVKAMRNVWGDLDSLLLVGGENLRQPYSHALQAVNIETQWIDSDDATLAGMRAIAQRHRI